MKWNPETKSWDRRPFTKEDAAWIVGCVLAVATCAMLTAAFDQQDPILLGLVAVQLYFAGMLVGWGSHSPSKKA
jgi:hypothetical protein